MQLLLEVNQMTDKETFDALSALIAEKIPGFEIAYKNENTVSKILAVLSWPFNSKYLTLDKGLW